MTHAARKIPTSLALILAGSLLVATTACGGAGSSADPAAADSAAASPGSQEGAPAQPAVPAVKVAFAADLPDGAFTALDQASIADASAIYVVADWTGVTADQFERLALTSPEGTVYYATSIALADGATSLTQAWGLDDGTRRVTFKLLIWGTPIESYQDVGTWTATVKLLDGTAGGTATFELR